MRSLVILLAGLSSISFVTGDTRAGSVMVAGMIVLSVMLRFLQDARAGAGEAKLKAMTPFARFSPSRKQRIVRVLRGKGRVVEFIGDGIKDSPVLRAADIRISVNNAANIAKESVDLILLQKNLMVLQGGVIEGRKVFTIL